MPPHVDRRGLSTCAGVNQRGSTQALVFGTHDNKIDYRSSDDMMYAGRCISRRNAPSYCCSSLSTFFRPDFVDASSIENCCSMCPKLSNCRRESFLSSTDNVSRRWMMLWISRSLSRRSWRSPRITCNHDTTGAWEQTKENETRAHGP